MSEPMRLGIVGAGAIARAYAAAIASGGFARLVAVADVDADAAEAMAAPEGAVAFPSHRALAASGLCEAVILTTPPATHADIAIDLAAHGLSILCEKPLSVDIDSAVRMTWAATQNGVLLSMASKFRFVDDVIRARAMLEAGEIGEPLLLENTFTSVVDMTARWNADPSIGGGGVLIDNGTHSVDIVRYLFGPITEVLAVPGPQIQPIAVEDSVTLMVRTESGRQAVIETSWSLHKDRTAFIGVYGDEGAIEIGWKGSRIRRQRNGAWETFGSGYDKHAAFSRQVEHFVGVLQGENLSLPDAQDALASVMAIQAAYRSIARGGWTSLDDRPRVAAAQSAARAP